jgi:hypothetical protein
MECEVSFLAEIDCMQLSGSRAELGQDAGQLTWRNALELAGRHPLATWENDEEIRGYFRDYGAWDLEEIAAWSHLEMSAMLLQEAAANYRDFEEHCSEDWEEYTRQAEQGRIRGQLWVDGDKVFCAFYR